MISPELYDSRFMRATRRESADTTPVWIMRQAGRYLPEYMAVRSKVTFKELCTRPDLAAEVTLTAQQALQVDAAILFADLLPGIGTKAHAMVPIPASKIRAARTRSPNRFIDMANSAGKAGIRSTRRPCTE